MTISACPCLSGLPYAECCQPAHDGTAPSPTAERLMRSRYSAFALGKVRYLLESWHPSTRPLALELEDGRRWISLEILGRSRGGMLDDEGTVEFIARYSDEGVRGQQFENSEFRRENRRWFYVAPVLPAL
jgi:SEC-C motif-containing protein